MKPNFTTSSAGANNGENSGTGHILSLFKVITGSVVEQHSPVKVIYVKHAMRPRTSLFLLSCIPEALSISCNTYAIFDFKILCVYS